MKTEASSTARQCFSQPDCEGRSKLYTVSSVQLLSADLLDAGKEELDSLSLLFASLH